MGRKTFGVNRSHERESAFKLNLILTSQRVIVKSGLIGKKVEEIELINVKDISVEQSITDRMLGVGSITVITLDVTSPEIVLDDVKDPNVVKDIIRNAVREEKAAHNISYRDNL
jgi:uncharacterized membrane protein YdbT with pleckstrin-like domain